MARRNLKGARILVTGASSGIGRELAYQLCQHGARVLATARRADRLLELQHRCQSTLGELTTLQGDLTDASHRQAIVDRIFVSIECHSMSLSTMRGQEPLGVSIQLRVIGYAA